MKQKEKNPKSRQKNWKPTHLHIQESHKNSELKDLIVLHLENWSTINKNSEWKLSFNLKTNKAKQLDTGS